MDLTPSNLFMETMTISEIVDNFVKTDGKKLEFNPERLKDFFQFLCKPVVCEECGGDGYADYGRGEDSEVLPCQVCYPNCSWADLREEDDRPDPF
jgi:hypothetical protein